MKAIRGGACFVGTSQFRLCFYGTQEVRRSAVVMAIRSTQISELGRLQSKDDL